MNFQMKHFLVAHEVRAENGEKQYDHFDGVKRTGKLSQKAQSKRKKLRDWSKNNWIQSREFIYHVRHVEQTKKKNQDV